MADYLAKLAARTLNLAKLVQPLSSLAIGEGSYLDTEYPSVSTIDSRKRSVSVDADQPPSTSEEKPRTNSVQTDCRSDSRVSVERSETPDPEHVERYRSDIPGTNVTPKRLVTKAEIEGVSHKRTRRRQYAETPVDTTFREQQGESVRDGSSPSKVGTRAEPLVDSPPALSRRKSVSTRDDTDRDLDAREDHVPSAQSTRVPVPRRNGIMTKRVDSLRSREQEESITTTNASMGKQVNHPLNREPRELITTENDILSERSAGMSPQRYLRGRTLVRDDAKSPRGIRSDIASPSDLRGSAVAGERLRSKQLVRDDTTPAYGDAGSSHIETRDTRSRGPVASLAREMSTLVSSARRPASEEVPASHIRRLRPAAPTVGASRQTVQVTIGRLEVRSAEPPAQPVRRESTRRSPALTLDEYLKRRNEGN